MALTKRGLTVPFRQKQEESFMKNFAIGLGIGLVVAIIVLIIMAIKQRRQEPRPRAGAAEDDARRPHGPGSDGLLKIGVNEELKRQNENLRITVSTYSQKPGRKEIARLNVYQTAVDRLTINSRASGRRGKRRSRRARRSSRRRTSAPNRSSSASSPSRPTRTYCRSKRIDSSPKWWNR